MRGHVDRQSSRSSRRRRPRPDRLRCPVRQQDRGRGAVSGWSSRVGVRVRVVGGMGGQGCLDAPTEPGDRPVPGEQREVGVQPVTPAVRRPAGRTLGPRRWWRDQQHTMAGLGLVRDGADDCPFEPVRVCVHGPRRVLAGVATRPDAGHAGAPPAPPPHRVPVSRAKAGCMVRFDVLDTVRSVRNRWTARSATRWNMITARGHSDQRGAEGFAPCRP